MKVHVFFTKNQTQLDITIFNTLLNTFPKSIQQDILKYQRWQDRQATLFGKLLLVKGLKILKVPYCKTQSIQKDAFQRPFLKNSKRGFDFNIAHCEGLVICALSDSGRVGVDVENIENIDIEDYRSVFTEVEFKDIQQQTSKKRNATFFKYWTRKEAVMKADGRGFYLSPSSFEAVEKEVIVANQSWYLQEIILEGYLEKKNLYSCHLAANHTADVQTYCIDSKALNQK